VKHGNRPPEQAEPALAGLLRGQVAVVTGGGRGNGRAIALALAGAGAHVCVADIDADAARGAADDIVAAGGRGFAVAWDIADPTQAGPAVASIHRTAGAASILVNNAGVEGGTWIGTRDYVESWRRVLNVNLDGTMLVTHALTADLKRARGCVVNVASIMSVVAYQPGASAYGAAKGALAQWTRSLAIELAPDGVRVNAIAPGFIETTMTAGTRADPARLAYFQSRTPMKRMGLPEEVASAVLFLASPLASYVTGVLLPVDGGLVAN
jgi:NAD(P)-dependent dehydrogenase (short-subunit alcohol dehydrogenase family)